MSKPFYLKDNYMNGRDLVCPKCKSDHSAFSYSSHEYEECKYCGELFWVKTKITVEAVPMTKQEKITVKAYQNLMEN